LQADSEYVYKSWIEALQQGIGAAIQHSDQRSTNQSSGNSQMTNDFNTLNNRLSSNSNKIRKSK
jgi:hypothetical protein